MDRNKLREFPDNDVEKTLKELLDLLSDSHKGFDYAIVSGLIMAIVDRYNNLREVLPGTVMITEKEYEELKEIKWRYEELK